MAEDRYIGYATIRKEIIDLPRSTFHELVEEHAFGPNQPPFVIRIGRKRSVYVRERAVRRWLEAGGTSTHQIIRTRDQRGPSNQDTTPDCSLPGGGEGDAGACHVGARRANDCNSITTSRTKTFGGTEAGGSPGRHPAPVDPDNGALQ